jgi:hypothetical protein
MRHLLAVLNSARLAWGWVLEWRLCQEQRWEKERRAAELLGMVPWELTAPVRLRH